MMLSREPLGGVTERLSHSPEVTQLSWTRAASEGWLRAVELAC